MNPRAITLRRYLSAFIIMVMAHGAVAFSANSAAFAGSTTCLMGSMDMSAMTSHANPAVNAKVAGGSGDLSIHGDHVSMGADMDHEGHAPCPMFEHGCFGSIVSYCGSYVAEAFGPSVDAFSAPSLSSIFLSRDLLVELRPPR